MAAEGRTPLTLTEGLHWLLQRPETLERGRCFMTTGSRKRKPDDGPDHRDAPKIGWCWAGNRHTWLGFASATGRRAVG
nr:DUF5701 family protein [Mycobacterium sp. URHB0044]